MQEESQVIAPVVISLVKQSWTVSKDTAEEI